MFDLKLKNYNNINGISDAKANKLINDGFFELIKYDYSISLNKEDDRIVTYNFYLINSLYKKPIVSISCDKNDSILECKSIYNIRNNNCYFIACIMLFENDSNNKTQYNNDLEKQKIVNKFVILEEKTRKEQYEKYRKKNLENVSSLIEELKKTDIIPLQNKVHLDYYFDITYNKTKLQLKLGIDKMYVVQNVLKLLERISSCSNGLYGKNFEFNHSIDNFDKMSQDVLSFVRNLPTNNTFSTANAFYLQSNDYDQIFNILKGRIVFFKKEKSLKYSISEYESYPYSYSYYDNISFDNRNQKIKDLEMISNPILISLDEYSLGCTLDEKYNLKLDNDTDIILFGDKHDYIIVGNELKVIKYDNYSGNMNAIRNLIQKLYLNNGQSFKYIEEVFRNEIYPRFPKYIKINENIKSELSLEDYSIKSYFDIDKNNILSVNTKYFKNDCEVAPSELEAVAFKVNQLQSFLSNLGFDEIGTITEMSKIVNFLRSDLTELQKISEIYLSENIKMMKVKKASKVSTRLSYNTGMLDVCFATSEFTDEELAKIIKSLKKDIKYIKLNKNVIIEIDDEEAKKLLNTVDEFDLDINKLTQSQTVPLYQSLKLLDNDIDICDYLISDEIKELIKDISQYKKAKFDYPEHLKDKCRKYQKEAFLWMKTLIKHNFCGILADDMGLGKTFEIISVLCSEDINKPVLIICPKSLCYNWKNEFELWGPKFNVINIIGSGPERKDIIDNIDNSKPNIYICSYDSLRNDIDYYKDKEFRFMILDEAQSIKNHETLKAKSVKSIKSDLRFVLTGTPIENTIIDLWSIFDFLMPKYLGVYSYFKGQYEKSIIETKDKYVINRLVKKITPFVLRRTKGEVLKDLPSKVESIRIASMDKKQKMIYDAELKKTRDFLEHKNSSKIELLAELTRLRQICVDPSLYISDYDGSSCKLDLLMEIIDDFTKEGHKIVIFSQFVSVFNHISQLLDKEGYQYFTLTGQTDALKRVEMANEFNNPNSIEKIFLVSLKAGGTGLNLVGADVVIHLDPWWNYAVEDQATDRTHRIGQTRSVNVIKMIVENSIEQKVIELQKIKKDIANSIIKNDSDNLEKLSVDDIKYILD